MRIRVPAALMGLLFLGACAASVNPALQTRVVEWFNKKSSSSYDATTAFVRPMPYAVGQYVVAGNTSGEDRTITRTALVGREGDAWIMETTSLSFSAETMMQMAVRGLEKAQETLNPDDIDIVWIKLKDDLSRLNRPELANKVMVGPAREDFVTKISSKLELAQKAFYSDEIFGNTGPLPPQAGTATTYTVTWQAKNYYSNVKEVAVRATLPPEAQFVPGKIFPEIQTAGLTYNEATREIVWNIGDMAAGQGLVSNPLNVSFQIAVSPMSSQIGGTAGIIGQAVIKGGDEWTEASLESVSPALDTASLSDPILIENSGIVQPKPN